MEVFSCARGALRCPYPEPYVGPGTGLAGPVLCSSQGARAAPPVPRVAKTHSTWSSSPAGLMSMASPSNNPVVGWGGVASVTSPFSAASVGHTRFPLPPSSPHLKQGVEARSLFCPEGKWLLHHPGVSPHSRQGAAWHVHWDSLRVGQRSRPSAVPPADVGRCRGGQRGPSGLPWGLLCLAEHRDVIQHLHLSSAGT